jgi:hypothetical protein
MNKLNIYPCVYHPLSRPASLFIIFSLALNLFDMNVGPPIHLYMCTFARGLSTYTGEREFPSAEWMETAESSKKASRMPSRTLALPRQEEKEKNS